VQSARAEDRLGDAPAAPAIGARSLVQARGGDVAGPASKIGGSTLTGQLGVHGGAAGEGDVQPIAAQGVAGGGGSLPHGEAIQRAFGRHDISAIQAHTGGDAQAASRAIGAEAYATGQQVAFAGAPSLHTAAHEAAHVVQQRGGVQLEGGVGARGDVHEQHADAVADRVAQGGSAEDLLDRYAGRSAGGGATAGAVQRRDDPAADRAGHTDGDKPPLRDWEVPEELAKLQGLRIDDASVRTVQEALETPPTGAFNAADVLALSRLRVAHGLSRYAEVTERTIDLLIQQGVALGMQDELLHFVTDVLRIDTRSDVLSIHYSATLEIASMTNFDPAGMRMILIGKTAFHSARTISRAIHAELAQPVPAATATGMAGGPAPTVLTPDEAEAAAGSNAGIISDERAARAIQRTLDAPVTGRLDVTTAQFVASRQRIMKIAPVDGTINEATLHEIIASLGRTFGEESAIRVIMDYYRIPDDGVTSVRFDPTLRGKDYQIENRGTRTAPAIVVGVDAFLQQPPRIAHTVGRAFEDVRLRGTGVRRELRDFLLERFVISGSNMGDEEFVPFMYDAVQALAKFKALDKADQDALSHEFQDVLNKVLARWGDADPDARKPFLEVEDEYMAMAATLRQRTP
jgi:hypothetical protein